MTRNEKSEIISKLEAEFKENEAIIVCDYRGLSTKKLEALRDAARVLNVKVQIVKNTLANIALNNVEKSGMVLKDTNIFIWGDQLSATKVAAKFEETNSELFKSKPLILTVKLQALRRLKLYLRCLAVMSCLLCFCKFGMRLSKISLLD